MSFASERCTRRCADGELEPEPAATLHRELVGLLLRSCCWNTGSETFLARWIARYSSPVKREKRGCHAKMLQIVDGVVPEAHGNIPEHIEGHNTPFKYYCHTLYRSDATASGHQQALKSSPKNL